MFGIIADLLTIATSVLFPIFASYKALQTRDPAQTAPWLMYWTVLSLITAVENLFDFILSWVPFYSWFRLLLHLWLVMPGQQGASALYQQQLHPFLLQHETQIDRFIGDAHDKAKAAGLNYVNNLVEWVKVNMLGLAPKPPAPPPSRYASYAEQLIGRFNMPAAREGAAVPGAGAGAAAPGAAGDFYGMLAGALQGVAARSLTGGGVSRDAQAADLSASGALIPPSIKSPEERLNYVSKQREGLRVLLQAFDREATNLSGHQGGPAGSAPTSYAEQHGASNLSKSRSEVDFERIESHEVAEGEGKGGKTPGQGGWMPWIWGGKTGEDAARSSGVDMGGH